MKTCKGSLEVVITARGAQRLPVPLVHLNDVPAWGAASDVTAVPGGFLARAGGDGEEEQPPAHPEPLETSRCHARQEVGLLRFPSGAFRGFVTSFLGLSLSLSRAMHY